MNAREKLSTALEWCHNARLGTQPAADVVWSIICMEKSTHELSSSIVNIYPEIGAIINQRIARVLAGDYNVLPSTYGTTEEEDHTAMSFRYKCKALRVIWQKELGMDIENQPNKAIQPGPPSAAPDL